MTAYRVSVSHPQTYFPADRAWLDMCHLSGMVSWIPWMNGRNGYDTENNSGKIIMLSSCIKK